MAITVLQKITAPPRKIISDHAHHLGKMTSSDAALRRATRAAPPPRGLVVGAAGMAGGGDRRPGSQAASAQICFATAPLLSSGVLSTQTSVYGYGKCYTHTQTRTRTCPHMRARTHAHSIRSSDAGGRDRRPGLYAGQRGAKVCGVREEKQRREKIMSMQSESEPEPEPEPYSEP
jgi:hypothetical protein